MIALQFKSATVMLLVAIASKPSQAFHAFKAHRRECSIHWTSLTTLRGGSSTQQAQEEPFWNRRQLLQSAGSAATLVSSLPASGGNDENFFPTLRGGMKTESLDQPSGDSASSKKARIAIIGAGWWAQGWHLPQLHRNEKAEIAAIVQHSEHPSTKLGDLDSRTALSEKYQSPWYSEVTDMLQDESLEPIDGVLVATPHSTHYDIGRTLFAEAHRRRRAGEKPLHIMMEKPITTDVDQAKELHDMVTEYRQKGGKGAFLVNHSANYREKAKIARSIVEEGKIGRIQHISAFFASPLMEIFDDPDMKGWNEPSNDKMIGNGFAWGQMAHMLGYLFHVCPDLEPKEVYCQMSHSEKTGADIAHAATITLRDCHQNHNVILSLGGTALVPGGETEGVGKQARVQIYGKEGALLYAGNDSQEDSGHMELRRLASGGKIEYPAGDGFYFENTEKEGDGPESLQNFIQACRGEDYYDAAGSWLGLKTVQVIHAMYRSNKSHQPEKVQYSNLHKDCIVEA